MVWLTLAVVSKTVNRVREDVDDAGRASLFLQKWERWKSMQDHMLIGRATLDAGWAVKLQLGDEADVKATRMPSRYRQIDKFPQGTRDGTARPTIQVQTKACIAPKHSPSPRNAQNGTTYNGSEATLGVRSFLQRTPPATNNVAGCSRGAGDGPRHSLAGRVVFEALDSGRSMWTRLGIMLGNKPVRWDM